MPDYNSRAHSVVASLREQGIDVVRVSYSDMIGVDRGRDVLLDELPAAVRHGLPFCRAIFHTSPQGDVVPVPGGLDAGLPDVLVKPDFSTLTPLPWEQGAVWAIGDVITPDGQPHAESPRAVLRRGPAPLAEPRQPAALAPRPEELLPAWDGEHALVMR